MELIMDNEDIYCKRFSCDCLHIGHIMDVTIEFCGDGNALDIDFSERHYGNSMSLWERTKNAFTILRGREIYGHGIILRKEDIGEMVEILQRAE